MRTVGLILLGLIIIYVGVRLAGKAWFESKKDYIRDVLAIHGKGGSKDGKSDN